MRGTDGRSGRRRSFGAQSAEGSVFVARLLTVVTPLRQ